MKNFKECQRAYDNMSEPEYYPECSECYRELSSEELEMEQTLCDHCLMIEEQECACSCCGYDEDNVNYYSIDDTLEDGEIVCEECLKEHFKDNANTLVQEEEK